MKVQLVHARRRAETSFVDEPGADPASPDPAEERDEDFVWSVGREEVPWPRPPRWVDGRWSWKRGPIQRRR